MNYPGDFMLPAKVYVIDGSRRPWWTLWLIRRERKRLVFADYIQNIHRSINGPVHIALVDAISRLRYLEVGSE